MNELLQKLYDLHLKTEAYPLGVPDKEMTDKEDDLYNFLWERLPEEVRGTFLDYIKIREKRHDLEKSAIYEYAFKSGIRLVFECIKE